MTSSGGILVFLEWNGRGLAPVSGELLAQAEKIGRRLCAPVEGVLLGNIPFAAARRALSGLPAETVFFYQLDGTPPEERQIEAVADCVEERRPEILLVGSTPAGRALAPAIAVRFGAGVTADCTGLSIDVDGLLVQTRPAFGGNLMADILTPRRRPQIAAVRAGVFSGEIRRVNRAPRLIRRECPPCVPRMELLSASLLRGEPRLADYRLLFAAGRGVKRRQDLESLKNLAQRLGGGLASSRALVEKGWMPSHAQIGLSGNSVKPDCLVTFGVSGSVQFAAGIRNAKRVIAVNTDPEAPIFSIAHDPVCADLYEVIPALARLLTSSTKEEDRHEPDLRRFYGND